MTDTEAAAERFAIDTANHTMTVLHDDGLYRHLRFKAPGTGFYWFDLVTWPGHLSFTGDVAPGYTFARTVDMFEFFRAKSGWNLNTINPQYWAEKVVTSRKEIKTYSEATFRQLVVEHFVEAVKYGDAPRGLGKAVREELLDPDNYDLDTEYEDPARDALTAFEFKGFRFTDTWEWDFTEYDWSYLWCCHAIQWGISQYDTARVAVGAGTES